MLVIFCLHNCFHTHLFTPTNTLFLKKDKVEWGRGVWGKPRKKKKEEKNVNMV
jgi:hypothetical protein